MALADAAGLLRRAATIASGAEAGQEGGYLGFVEGLLGMRHVQAPARSVTVASLHPELTPLYVTLKLARCSLPEQAAHLWWFANGRPRALYDEESARVYLSVTLRELLRVAENPEYRLAPALGHAANQSAASIRHIRNELVLAFERISGEY